MPSTTRCMLMVASSNVILLSGSASYTVKLSCRQGTSTHAPFDQLCLNAHICHLVMCCSNMEEFRTLCNLTRQLCKVLFGSDVQLQTQRIDEGGLDGDLCAVITAAGSSKAVAVVWPTAEKLKDIKRLAEVGCKQARACLETIRVGAVACFQLAVNITSCWSCDCVLL